MLLYGTALILFAISVLLFLKRHPLWLPGLIFLLFSYTWLLLSNIVLEQGFYIIEQNRTSSSNGSYLILLGYMSLFFTGYIATARLLDPVIPRISPKFRALRFGIRYLSPKRVEVFIFWIIVAILTVLMAHTLISGSPFFSGTDVSRANFWVEGARFPQIVIIHNQVLALLFAFSACASSTRLKVYLTLITIIHFALLGQRFSPIILTVYVATFTALQQLRWKKLLAPRFFAAGTAFLFTITILTYFSYAAEGRAEDTILEFAIYRFFVLQGHTWWGVVELVQQVGTFDYLQKLIAGDSMELVMRLIAPNSVVDTYVAGGSGFTMAYPAILHLTLGYWAMPLQFAVGAIFAIAVFSFHSFARIGFVGAYFSAKIFIAVVFFLLSGRTSYLSDIHLLLYAMLLLAYMLVVTSLEGKRLTPRLTSPHPRKLPSSKALPDSSDPH